MAENNCSEQTAPLDAAAAAKAAFGEVAGEPFPKDIYAAPQLTWAVIGCGVIANQMATSLALSGRHLRGVANRTREKAEAFAERYGVERVYDSVEELYQDPSVDAIYITTPHNTHIRYLAARSRLASTSSARSPSRSTPRNSTRPVRLHARTTWCSWMPRPSSTCRSTRSFSAVPTRASLVP